jgi:signal transduction histidine kinase
MDVILWLSDSYPVLLPPSLIGLLGWLSLLVLVGWLLWSTQYLQSEWASQARWIFGILIFLQIIFALTPGLRLPIGASPPVPNSPQELKGPALMLLSTIPWMVAGGMLGPIAGAFLGLIAGLIRFLWDSHSVFTPLELALLGAVFSLIVRQRYRTSIFRLFSQPLVAAALLALLYIPLYIIDAFMVVVGPSISLADSLIYAISSAPYAILAVAVEVLIGGVFAQVLSVTFPAPWGRHTPLQPSPTERSIEARFLFGTGTMIIFLLIALLVGDWYVAGAAARDMLNNRMQGAAEQASQVVPYFLETGQNLATQFSQDPQLAAASGEALANLLSQQMRAIPFFDQLIVLDHSQTLLASYPPETTLSTSLFPQEKKALDLALVGVISQTYSIPPLAAGQPARISFIISILDVATGQTGRVLIGRTSLATNPFTQPLIQSLQSMAQLHGEGILLDENQVILYHPLASQVMGSYSGQLPTEASFFDDIGRTGTRNFIYYQPVTGRAWAVVLTVPAQQAQQLALNIAAPLSGMIFLLALIALISLRVGLKTITISLQNLASEAVRIAQGQLDHPLIVEGVDEVGQLRKTFEQMRVSLQARLEELNRLLLVSQGVASSLEFGEAVQPIMEAVLATGANAVRLYMPPLNQESEQEDASIFALGPSKEKYAYLDAEILRLTQQQDRLVMTNVSRARGLQLGSGRAVPASLVAVPLRHENSYHGVLWAVFDQPHLFSETDVRFLTMLAGQAALAASNHHLFRTAEVGRQRLAAILASTPDPVLVTDQYNRLLLSNPAAWQVLGASIGNGTGQPIENLITQKPLLEILLNTSSEKLSAEVTVLNHQVYLATASPVLTDGRQRGRVCILRNITHFKELDTMKTEFVSTVSHDLRSPLTLMRGYATMLEMVGTLNEQQQGYVQKIVVGVENMSRMVNNLLDLGRIEAGVGLRLQSISLVDILERVFSTLQPQAAQKKIEIAVEKPQNTFPIIEADPALLEQALYNLVENAIKYTPQGGRVKVRLTLTPDQALFEVEDTGIGVAPIDQTRLFEKFYRGGQREAREQKGSGLGLAIVRSIIEWHGGRVWLESQLGKGSTFFLQIPLRQPKPARENIS